MTHHARIRERQDRAAARRSWTAGWPCRRADRRGRRGTGARARHRSRRRPAGAGTDRAAHRPPGEPPEAAPEGALAGRGGGRRLRRADRGVGHHHGVRFAARRRRRRRGSHARIELAASSTPSTRPRAQDLLRADHRLHLRCEICADDVVEQTRAPSRPACRGPDVADGPHARRPPVRRPRRPGGPTTAASPGCRRPSSTASWSRKRALFASNYARHRRRS